MLECRREETQFIQRLRIVRLYWRTNSQNILVRVGPRLELDLSSNSQSIAIPHYYHYPVSLRLLHDQTTQEHTTDGARLGRLQQLPRLTSVVHLLQTNHCVGHDRLAIEPKKHYILMWDRGSRDEREFLGL